MKDLKMQLPLYVALFLASIAASPVTAPPRSVGWDALTSLSTALLVIVTWYMAFVTRKAVREQIAAQTQAQSELLADQRLAKSVDVILRFDDRWESTGMHAARKAFCLAIKAERQAGSAVTTRDLDEPARQLLSFFETLAVVTRRARIDVELVWSEFSWYVIYYHALLEPTVRQIHDETRDTQFYEDFTRLASQLRAIEQQKTAAATKTTKDLIDAFLRSECALT